MCWSLTPVPPAQCWTRHQVEGCGHRQRAAEQEAVREASVAEARAKTLQEAHDALLGRVAPAAPGD
jgi:hypothetical protein